MLGRITQNSGGVNIINSLVEEYKVASGGQVKSGDFVYYKDIEEYIKERANELNLDGLYYFDFAKLTDNKIIVCYGYKSYYVDILQINEDNSISKLSTTLNIYNWGEAAETSNINPISISVLTPNLTIIAISGRKSSAYKTVSYLITINISNENVITKKNTYENNYVASNHTVISSLLKEDDDNFYVLWHCGGTSGSGSTSGHLTYLSVNKTSYSVTSKSQLTDSISVYSTLEKIDDNHFIQCYGNFLIRIYSIESGSLSEISEISVSNMYTQFPQPIFIAQNKFFVVSNTTNDILCYSFFEINDDYTVSILNQKLTHTLENKGQLLNNTIKINDNTFIYVYLFSSIRDTSITSPNIYEKKLYYFQFHINENNTIEFDNPKEFLTIYQNESLTYIYILPIGNNKFCVSFLKNTDEAKNNILSSSIIYLPYVEGVEKVAKKDDKILGVAKTSGNSGDTIKIYRPKIENNIESEEI